MCNLFGGRKMHTHARSLTSVLAREIWLSCVSLHLIYTFDFPLVHCSSLCLSLLCYRIKQSAYSIALCDNARVILFYLAIPS